MSAAGTRRRDTPPEPAYLSLHRSGARAARVREDLARLESCDLCARNCRVDRTRDGRGAVCRSARHAVVSSAFPHHREEDPIRGWRGSGTIFLSHCNLRCTYCQNREISWKGEGREVDADTLARLMLELQRAGCHNINFVSPSHVVAQILEALDIAAGEGLRLPLVYNSGGYDSPEALALLDGVIDIYLPDMKYGDPEVARRYSHVREYVHWNRAAIREMHREVGDLVVNDEGVAVRGLLVRLCACRRGAARGRARGPLSRCPHASYNGGARSRATRDCRGRLGCGFRAHFGRPPGSGDIGDGGRVMMLTLVVRVSDTVVDLGSGARKTLLPRLAAVGGDRSGVTAVEYGPIVAGVSLAVIIVVFAFGEDIQAYD